MPFDNEAIEIEPKPGPSLILAMWRYRWMSLALVGCITFLSAAVGAYLVPPATATATLALKTPRQTNVLAPGLQGDASLARYTAQRTRFITSDAVMSDVAEQLGINDPGSIRKRISAEPSATSNVINISVTAAVPADAVKLAEAILAAYRSQTLLQVEQLSDAAISSIRSSQAELEQQLAQSPAATVDAAVAATLSQLQLQASEIESSSALLGDGVEFVVAPTIESVEVAGLPTREIALGFLVGLIVAGSVAWLRADQTSAPDADEPDAGALSVPYGESQGNVPFGGAAVAPNVGDGGTADLFMVPRDPHPSARVAGRPVDV